MRQNGEITLAVVVMAYFSVISYELYGVSEQEHKPCESEQMANISSSLFTTTSNPWVTNLWPAGLYCAAHSHICKLCIYEGWNFNFGNTPLDWIQELLE